MSCSCATDTPAGATFDDVVLWSYNSDSLYVVIAGDLSTYKLIKEESMIKKSLTNADFRSFFCDLSLPENLNARRLLSLVGDSFPIIIFIRAGKMIRVSDNYCETKKKILETRKSANLSICQEKDSVFINQLNTIYIVQNNVNSENTEMLNSCIQRLIPYVDDGNIYVDCLLAMLYRRIGNEIEYVNIMDKILVDDRFTSNPLFFSMMNDYFDENEITDPVLKVDSTRVNLGQLRQGDIKECFVGLRNLGKSNLIVYQVAASCSCVVLSCDKIIPPQESAFLRIKFQATDSPGAFYKEVFLTTNVSSIRIPVVGTIYNN